MTTDEYPKNLMFLNQVKYGVQYNSVKLQYFDRLLGENVTSTIACKTPVSFTSVLQTPARTEVTCGLTDVAVKIPAGRVLRKVKVHGKDC